MLRPAGWDAKRNAAFTLTTNKAFEKMNYKTLKLENQNAVWTLTLNRPEALNALNNELLSELSQVLTSLAEKNLQEAKVLILTGSGEKAFVAGADIKEINQLKMDSAEKFAEKG